MNYNLIIVEDNNYAFDSETISFDSLNDCLAKGLKVLNDDNGQLVYARIDSVIFELQAPNNFWYSADDIRSLRMAIVTPDSLEDAAPFDYDTLFSVSGKAGCNYML